MSDLKVESAEVPANPTSEIKSENGGVEAAVETDAAASKNAEAESNGDQADTKEVKHEQKNGRNGVRTYENGMLKTSAQEQLDSDKNSKYDPSVLAITDNPQEIRGQVEFYFGDANLPTDKFMMKETGGADNRPISLQKIVGFGRMKRFKPYSAVVAALKESKSLNVTGAEGKEMVSRKTAWDPTTPKSKSEARSVYVKGFGDEEPSSQFDIEAFFAQYGSTNAVRLRRTDEKLFKGSVFVEFSDEETAQKFLALDPEPQWKGKHVLEIMSKTAYIEKKKQEIADGKIQPNESWGESRGRGGHGRGRGRGRGFRNNHDGGRDRGDRDPDDWKKRREHDRASGFKDDRGRNHRGGRGRRDDRGPRNDRGPRPNDRNREREEKDEVKTEVKADAGDNDKKRPREDDGADEKPAKKVDVKPEVTTEAS